LQHWARHRPSGIAFHQIEVGQTTESIDFSTLRERVDALASHLETSGLRGQRVAVVFPTGIDFVLAFLACLSAGAIAVPSDLPRRRGKGERLQRLLEDAGAAAILTGPSFAARLHQGGDLAAMASGRQILTLDQAFPAPPASWRPVDPASDDLALLQYTSGSTCEPRGVMITQGSLVANCRMISEAFALSRRDSSFSWLPGHHDMGLVGGILTTLLWGEAGWLLNPAAFLTHPLAWLRAISDHGITVSGGPDFAYRWCVDRITPAEVATLDLSRWRVAFTGAERVRAATLSRFCEHFAPAGFRPDSFFPCYGLAEATLMLSGGPCGEVLSRPFDAAKLRKGIASPVPAESPAAPRLLSSGLPASGVDVRIVDPETLQPRSDGEIGEIWVRSPTVGVGYWENPVETRERFGATLAGDERSWLRTGDLGFLEEGRLFVTGRRSTRLIVRGENHAAEDLERTLEESVPGLVAGAVAVFACESGDREQIIVLAERARGARADDQTTLGEMQRHLAAAHGLTADEIHLVKAGSLPRTSSGKIRRFLCRDRFESDTLDSLAVLRAGNERSREILSQLSFRLGLGEGPLDPAMRLDSGLGLDSLGRVSLLHELARETGIRLDESAVGRFETVGDLVRMLETTPRGENSPPPGKNRLPDFPEIIQFGKTRSALLAEGYDDPYFKVFEDLGGGLARVEGRELIQFGSYHYLGFSRHPEVTEAAARAARQVGTSAGASRLVTGNRAIHVELETTLARFLGTESALAFVGGHATNETVIGHLFGPGDLILHDSLAHNSLIEGAKLSGARRWAFPHNDLDALDAILTEQRPRFRRVLLVVEGVYSMDGDLPDLARLVELKHRHGALLMLDEAHSLGTLGATGRGLTEDTGVPVAEVDLLMGTLSKAFASCGGFIAASRVLIDYLSHTAPGFVYSVGMPPASAAAALAAIGLLEREPWRVERLRQLSLYFHETAATRGLEVGGTVGTPVIPFLTGNAVEALTLSSALAKAGFIVPPVLPPAVPENGARLRFFLTCDHREDQIDAVLEALAKQAGAAVRECAGSESATSRV
jgi:8-amino-7-oxononanoate synthase